MVEPNSTQRSPLLLRFDIRALIALTTAAAGVFAIGREDFWLGSCFAVVLAAPLLIMLRLSEETRDRRIRVFVFSLVIGSLGILVGYVLRSVWTEVVSGSRHSDRDLSFSWNAPLLISSLVAALLSGLYVVNERWGKRVRNFLLVSLAVCSIGMGYLFHRSSSERWLLSRQVKAYVARTEKPVDRKELIKQWAQRLFGTQHEYAPTIDETIPKADYWRFAKLRRAQFLFVKNVDLTQPELELVSQMPSVRDVVFDNASLPENGLSGFDLQVVQFWRSQVEQSELRQLLTQPRIDCVGLHEVQVVDSFFETMSQIPKLGTLLITRTDLSKQFDISNCLSMSRLRIANSSVTDALIAKIAKQEQARTTKSFTPLDHLYLGGNPITDECINDLLTFTSLTELDVTDTKLTAEGIQRLQTGLPATKITNNVLPDN